MEISRAIATVDQAQEGTGSVTGTSALSERERIFVDCFIVNGGKGTEAALSAGCPEGSAHVEASRMLCRKRVADAIVARCHTLIQAALPVAIKALLDIAADDQALRKDRIKAATSLLEHGGMAAPKGGFQVNVAVVNGSEAQKIIAEVHDARAARLSDIPPAMPDTLEADFEAIEQLAIGPPASTPGGDHIQGPAAGSCPLPVHASEHLDISGVSDDDPADPKDTFRKAFDDDEG